MNVSQVQQFSSLVFYQLSYKRCNYFLMFVELVLMLAIRFVSTVTERANHARDHLKTEAKLDKYDG